MQRRGRGCKGLQGVALRVADKQAIGWTIAVAPGLQFDNASDVVPVVEEASRAMSRIVASLALLLLAVMHAPTQAQALVFSVFGDIFPFSTSEPVMLFLTGVALLSLAQLGRPNSR